MEGRQTIKIDKEADRDTVAMILVRNDYCVQHIKQKIGKSNAYTHYIQYWKEDSRLEKKLQENG